MPKKNAAYHRELDRALEGDEDAALSIYGVLKNTLGWAGTPWTKGDVEGILQSALDDADANLTEEEWSAIQADWSWRQGLDDATEAGWDLIREAVDELPRVHVHLTKT